MKFLEIKITKAVLFLTEQELVKALPQELLIEGLRRGKAIMRSRQAKERAQREKHSKGALTDGKN